MTIKRASRNVLIGTSLALTLSACGGGGGRDSQPQPPTVVTTKQEDKFGTQFGADFRVPANSEPSPVNDGDIVPVSLTTQPVDIT